MDEEEYYSSMRKNEILPFVTTWMVLEGITLSEMKSDRERQILYITYMGNIKSQTHRNRVE